jgi:hypothetical protein
LRREWKRIENMPWKMSTKERVLMERVSKNIGGSFRKYAVANISG